jgi:hypothetical protein
MCERSRKYVCRLYLFKDRYVYIGRILERYMESIAEFRKYVDSENAKDAVSQLRSDFNPELFKEVPDLDRPQMIRRGTEAVHYVLGRLKEMRAEYEGMCPGHGPGHLIRDYAHALALFSRLDVDPKQSLVGLVGGTLHDIGCTVVERYDENKRVVRHAEASALLLQDIFRSAPKEMISPAEKVIIPYAVAAHTHYREEQQVEDSDEVIEPYQDSVDGGPILGVWFPRWVDRLDCNGPTFVARHYLTLVETHEDFDGEKFFEAEYSQHMRSLLRKKEEREGPPTMLEHLNMFANSQTNDSPYGKHDQGEMVLMRNRQTERLSRIIKDASSGKDVPFNSDEVISSWHDYLVNNVEPFQATLQTSEGLQNNFDKLPIGDQNAWMRGFNQTLREYGDYAEWLLEILNTIPNLPKTAFSFPGIADDIREIIPPRF